MPQPAKPSPAPGPHPRTAWPRILCALLLVLAGVVVLFSTAGFLAWRVAMGALPQLDGDVRIAAVQAPVEVFRDARGTPHLYAATIEDVIAAQGYLHAQDRLWQMDIQRRAAAGELSEVFGRGTLELDRENRTLGFRVAAEHASETLPAEAKALVEAYARGVNAFIADHQANLPVEFRLLRYRPAPWQPRDSYLVALNMYKSLTYSWPTELRRAQITARIGPELAADLFPTLSLYDRPIAEPVKAPRTRASVLPKPVILPATISAELSAGAADFAAGSNNWVVSGQHTASGAPLLANDMHLPLNVPAIWYMVHLVAPGLNVAGVSLPGVPLVICGHNEQIAWGFTNLGADVQDLYEETFDANNPSLYLANGRWLRVQLRKETISIRGSAPAGFDVVLTRHGPIVRQEGQKAYALRWTATEPGGLDFPFLAWAQARHWEEFRQALRHFPGPAQNVVYADRVGNIGYQGAGLVPIRRSGTGAMPVPGQTDDFEWIGYIPFEAMPSSFNPPGGILATANGRVVPADYPYLITNMWQAPYRTARIFELLERGERFTPQDFLRIQGDITSLANRFLAAQLVAAAAHLRPMEPAIQEATQALARWDGRATTDSAETSLCEYTRREAMRMLLEPKLPANWQEYRWPLAGVFFENVLRQRPARWLPSQYKDYDALLLDALRAAFTRLKKDVGGSDWRRWRWGRLMQIEMTHPLGDRIPILRRLFNIGPYPVPGTVECVKQTSRRGGPSDRMVIDFANLDNSLLSVPAGQSGQIGSPYYRDEFQAWLEVESFPLAFSEPAVKRAAQHHLRLLPGSPIGSTPTKHAASTAPLWPLRAMR